MARVLTNDELQSHLDTYYVQHLDANDSAFGILHLLTKLEEADPVCCISSGANLNDSIDNTLRAPGTTTAIFLVPICLLKMVDFCSGMLYMHNMDCFKRE